MRLARWRLARKRWAPWRLAKVGADEVRPLEVGFQKVGPLEVGFRKVGPLEVGTTEVGPLEVGAAEVGLCTFLPVGYYPLPMRFKNLCQFVWADLSKLRLFRGGSFGPFCFLIHLCLPLDHVGDKAPRLATS